MLKIECVNCHSWFQLPFNSEGENVECPKCKQKTPAKDIYVAAGPYMIFREVLIKNMPKYRRLILEAEKEMVELEKRALKKTYDISAKSVNAFISNLREMLDGCRDTVRYRPAETSVEYTIEGKTYEGDIVNISMTGMCLDGRKTAPVISLWSAVELQFKHGHKPFGVNGKIVWMSKEGLMGVKFSGVGKDASELLRSFIMEKSGLKEI
ncbi:MAG TPA: PilZ domain-containing protein [Thermodesulfobacteriota bacterium]|nr:PilZ domain-containing protein [Thermodesulfobacteriota bacterium]